MNTTPVSNRLSSRSIRPESSSNLNYEESPGYIPNTQESNEEIDVLWDWNSPQAPEKRTFRRKRLLPTNSPKFQVKRYQLSTQAPNFEELRGELEALKQQLATPDEDLLCVSPSQEEDLRQIPQSQARGFSDFFDDTLDEQKMILISQQFENAGAKAANSPVESDDSMDFIMEAIKDEDFDSFTRQSTQPIIITFPKISEITPQFNPSPSKLDTFKTKSCEMEVTKVTVLDAKLNRTRSCEVNNANAEVLPKNVLDEIEKKRREALAKLELKKRTAGSGSETTSTMLNTQALCSKEEIEQKRLQALAKLEAKKRQEMIEKNRQEALKRLEQSKMKNVKRL